MALLYVDGFEMGDFALRYSKMVLSAAIAGPTNTRFNLGKYLTGSGSTGDTCTRGIPAATRAIVGFAFYMTANDGVRECATMWGDSGVTEHMTLRPMTNGALALYRGTTTQVAVTAGGLIPLNTWVYIEFSTTISDTVGVAKVRLNGTEVLSFTGDTRNGGTNQTIDMVGLYYNGAGSWRFDDYYISDDTGPAPWNDFLGDVRVVTLSPNGPGNSTGLTPSVAPNWGCVDEQPYSATDYVSSSVAGTKDTYACADLPAGALTVYGVQVNTIAKKSDAGARSLKNVVRVSGTDYSDAVAQVMATTDSSYRTMRAVNPATSAAWTPAVVNAMEIGVEVA